MLVSVIIPCYQNETQLIDTVARIYSATELLQEEFEVILIDDGSTDDTWRQIHRLFEGTHGLRGIKLKKNFGAYNAILAGLENAKGEALLIMAADGDDPPELIPQLVNMVEGNEAVLANRKSSRKSFGNVIGSFLFYGLLRFVGAKNIPEGGSDFLIVERHVYHKCKSQGFKSGNTLIQLVQHAKKISVLPYTKGRSKPTTWSFKKKLTLFFQSLNSFTPIPFVKSEIDDYEIEAILDR